MDADREREIRDLAERLLVSKRHRRIGIVLTDMLAEIDLLRAECDRDRDEPTMTREEARRRIMAYAKHVSEGTKGTAWGEAARRARRLYPAEISANSEASPSS